MGEGRAEPEGARAGGALAATGCHCHWEVDKEGGVSVSSDCWNKLGGLRQQKLVLLVREARVPSVGRVGSFWKL